MVKLATRLVNRCITSAAYFRFVFMFHRKLEVTSYVTFIALISMQRD